MSFDWKSWCRFCGNSENNVKFEYAIDIEHYFKISDQHPKICQECCASLTEFQEFLQKTKKSNQLFEELANQKNLDNTKINGIREKFGLEPLEFEVELTESFAISLPILEIKEEVDIYDLPEEFKKALQDDKVINEKEEISDDKSETDPPKKRRRRRRRQPPKPKVIDPMKQKEIESYASVNEIIRMICHVCDTQFPSIQRLIEHCEAQHNCNIQVPCICGKTLYNYSLFLRHRRKCCKVLFGIYQCDLCPRSYAKKHQLESHMRTRHINVILEKFDCKTCGKEFKSKQFLKLHEVCHLPEELRETFACSQCDKKFKSKFYLGTHISKVHENKPQEIYTCHMCVKTFNMKKSLELHIETHNTSLDFECETCSTKFKSKSLLQIHKRGHLENKFFCKICNQGFKRAQGRTNHMITHTDARPFACIEPDCDFTFKRKCEMVVHHNRVHLGKQRFICQVCGQDFYYTKDRFEHIKKEHPIEFVEFARKWKHNRARKNENR